MSALVEGELDEIMLKAIEKGWPVYYITPDQKFIDDIMADCPKQYCVIISDYFRGGCGVLALYRGKWQMHNASARPLTHKLISYLVSVAKLEQEVATLKEHLRQAKEEIYRHTGKQWEYSEHRKRLMRDDKYSHEK